MAIGGPWIWAEIGGTQAIRSIVLEFAISELTEVWMVHGFTCRQPLVMIIPQELVQEV